MSAQPPPTTNGGTPRKRTQQACEPCRRKKSKCCGKRPTCWLCHRLGRTCFYKAERLSIPSMENQVPGLTGGPSTSLHQASEEAQGDWHQRLNIIENTLTNLLSGLKDDSLASTLQSSSRSTTFRPTDLRPGILSPVSTISPPTTDRRTPSSDFPTTDLPLGDSSPTIKSWAAAVRVAQTFLQNCDSQPLPLFDPRTLVSSFPNRPFEVVYSVLAMAHRFIDQSERVAWHESLPAVGNCRQEAHRLAMSSISNGRIQLSTLQTLCVLGLIELYEGNMTQCRVYSTLAMTLARSAQLDRDSHGSYIWDDHTVEERRRCYWSIILLHHTIGEPLPGPLPLVLRRSKPQFPASAPSPPSDVLNPEGRMVASLEVPTQEHGICFVVIQLSEAWSMAQCYIRNRGRAADGSPERLPPWHKSSQYSSTLELVMNLGDSLPPAHRYRFIHLTKVDSEELRQSRDYWAPWLLSRLLYHTTLCILNHPILIMLQIQGNRDISEVFLHQTTSARMHHSSWLMHFIQFMYNRDFYVSDPIFGYCAAVLATIELHQCFVEGHKQTATRRRQNFTHCVDFVGKLSDRWPYMQNAAESLHQLMETTAELCRKNAGNPNANKVRVDISGFLRILDFTQFCSPVNSTSPFGPTLVAHQLDPRPQVSPESTLEQLPAITEIDRQTGPPASPPALAPQVDRAPTTNSWNLPSQVSDSSLLPQLTGVFDEYTSLQADQLFGTLYDCMAPWDTVPAHAPAF